MFIIFACVELVREYDPYCKVKCSYTNGVLCWKLREDYIARYILYIFLSKIKLEDQQEIVLAIISGKARVDFKEILVVVEMKQYLKCLIGLILPFGILSTTLCKVVCKHFNWKISKKWTNHEHLELRKTWENKSCHYETNEPSPTVTHG